MKIKGSSISLNDIKFHSKIGLYDFEKQEGNDFIVNISVQVDDLRYDDKISSTVDYGNIFDIIPFLYNIFLKLSVLSNFLI